MSDHDTWNMFAAAAAQGMCAYHGSYGLNNGPGDIAMRAYDIADALLAESKKRETPEPLSTEPVAWLRDLDGTGSLHPASEGDPGAFPVYAEPLL